MNVDLPALLRSDIENALGERIMRMGPIGGGCISNAMRLETDGGTVFLKWDDKANAARMLHAEASGLRALGETGTVRVPNLIAVCEVASRPAWLLAEWLASGSVTSGGWQRVGRALAGLHRCSSPRFGFDADNFIGSLDQHNGWLEDWPAFWSDRRIRPQLEIAGSTLSPAARGRIDVLLSRVGELAAAGNSEGPSLLHGDLWNGNVRGLVAGDAALIDPSCYYGHREVDLAMARLFGGFDSRFFDAYGEEWPLLPGHEERMLLYQMYYLLVHVNLFGGSYVHGTMSVVERLGF